MRNSRSQRSLPARTTLVEVSGEDWLVGKVIADRYRVERVLGEGGMGRVYEVSDTTFHRRLVLKTLLPGLTDDKTVWPRFLREARAAADLGSPHIVAVQDFGDLDDGRSYYVMELADGVTLDAVLDEADGPLPLARALHIARGVAHALEAAHAAKVVHRDLKPDNVLLVVEHGQTDFVKIVDFGLALMMNAAVRITGRGELVGSPYYMSPEQCADEAIDGRADIYALGVILFEMLSLELPHDGDSMVKVLQSKLREAPPSPNDKGADVPPDVEAVVLKCLARSPADRFASAAALGSALDALIAEHGDAPVAAGVPRFRAPTSTPPIPAAAPPASAPGSTAPPEPIRESPAPPPPSAGRAAILLGIFVAAAALAGLLAWVLRG